MNHYPTRSRTDGTASKATARRAGRLLIAVAVASGLAGLALAVHTARDQPVRLGSAAHAEGVALAVHGAEWVAHEGHDMPGMTMAGMPPEGFRRLHLEVALSNAGPGTRGFEPRHFGLVGGTEHWRLESSSFVTGTFTAGQAIAGDLFFDVPETNRAPLALAWTPGQRTLKLEATPGKTSGDGDHHDDGSR